MILGFPSTLKGFAEKLAGPITARFYVGSIGSYGDMLALYGDIRFKSKILVAPAPRLAPHFI